MRYVSFALLAVVSIVFIVSVIAVANASSVQDYSYFKSHNITGSQDGVLHNYQVQLVVHSGNGTDYSQDVYLGGHSQSWPNDIRFTDNAGNLLNYWIESYDASTAVIWVNVDDIPASPASATIDIYYGRQDDAGASNGDATFNFFDDFNNNVIDKAKWGTPTALTTVNEDGGVLRITTDDTNVPGYLPTLNDFDDCVIEERVRVVQNTGTPQVYHIILVSRANVNNYVQTVLRGVPKNDFYIYDGSFEAGPVFFENLDLQTGEWHRITFTLAGESVTSSVLNENSGASKTISGTTSITAPGKIEIGSYERGIINEVDYIFVRTYVRDTPINGGWSKETVTPVNEPANQANGTVTPANGTAAQPSIPQWLMIVLVIVVLILGLILLVAMGMTLVYLLGKAHK